MNKCGVFVAFHPQSSNATKRTGFPENPFSVHMLRQILTHLHQEPETKYKTLSIQMKGTYLAKKIKINKKRKCDHTVAQSRPLQPHGTEGEAADHDQKQTSDALAPMMEGPKVRTHTVYRLHAHDVCIKVSTVSIKAVTTTNMHFY